MKSQFAKILAAVFFLGVACQLALADIPVHCLYENVYGTWTFYKTEPNYDNQVIYNQCSIDKKQLPTTKLDTVTIKLSEPNIAILMGKPTVRGHFTMVYDQGMEIKVDGLKYFAFFNYTEANVNNHTIVTSHCDQTFVGTYHDNSIPAKKWGCFKGFKSSSFQAKTVHSIDHAEEKIKRDFEHSTVFVNNDRYIQALNKAQSTWKATAHKQFEGMTFAELKRITGSYRRSYQKTRNLKKQQAKLRAMNADKVTLFNGKTGQFESQDAEKLRASLPTEFDWANVNGRDFVVPVRNQEQCGSCYAFSSSDMFGSRVRIHSNLTQVPVYSPQDIVDCSAYSQGCDGGFPFLVGKYAMDYGLTVESCDPYQGHDLGKCSNQCPVNRQQRLHSSNYYFVGGYYGNSHELSMMHEIYQNGPLAIGFEVYPDLRNYKHGVYKHVTAEELKAQGLSEDEMIPHFEVVNHAVLMVGWGVENGTPYWKIKNSWSTTWGDNGYFKILRGSDECGVESDAEAGIPLF